MKKKLLSLFMACAMVLALAVPAFAADPYFEYDSESDQLTQPITFAARMFVPTVKLYMPKINDNPIVLNPYKIKYDASIADANKLNGASVLAADQDKQVISPVYKIKNETDVKLNYTVTATATAEGKLQLANAQVPANDTGNKAYVAVVFRKVSILEAAPYVSPNNDTAQNLDGSDKATFETLILKTTGEAKTDATQPKYLEPAANSGTAITPNFLEFQFQGSLSRLSTNPWTADDKLTVNMTFTFTPESGIDVNGTTDLTFATAFSIASPADTMVTSANLYATGSASLPSGATANIVEVTDAPADPEWVIVGAGAYGAKINKTAGTGGAAATYTLQLDKAKVSAQIAAAGLTTGGTITDRVILGYMDNKGFPRTVSVPVKITLAA